MILQMGKHRLERGSDPVSVTRTQWVGPMWHLCPPASHCEQVAKSVSGSRFLEFPSPLSHVWKAENHPCHATASGHLERVGWGCQLQRGGPASPLPGSRLSSLLPRACWGLLLQLTALRTKHLAGWDWAWLGGWVLLGPKKKLALGCP